MMCLLIMSLINLFALFCIILPQIHSNPDCNVCACLFNKLYCNAIPDTEIPLVWPFYNTQFVTRIEFLNSNIRVLRRNNFINFPSLVKIVIQNSQLSEIEEGAFNGVASRLINIDFTNNELNMLNPRWFLNMKSLTGLILTNNRIEFVPPNSFADLTNLEKLYLNNNQIKRISIGNLDILNSSALTDIKLGTNPFVCDCYLIWLQQILMDMPIKFTDLEQVKCEYPSNVTGEQVAITFLPSTFCLNLCLAVNCTENSSCTIENSFPTCVCESGFDPIGNGTYECTSAPRASTTIISNSIPSTDTTSSVRITSLITTNTRVPIISTTDIPTHSTTVHTSILTNTLGPIISTTDIPNFLTTVHTSILTTTLGPIISTTLTTTDLTLSTIASSFSSHLVTPTTTPNNTNSFKPILLIPISFTVIFTLIGVYIVCLIAFAVALRIKKGKEAGRDEHIEMTVIGPNIAAETDDANDRNINPHYDASGGQPPELPTDQVAPID